MRIFKFGYFDDNIIYGANVNYNVRRHIKRSEQKKESNSKTELSVDVTCSKFAK